MEFSDFLERLEPMEATAEVEYSDDAPLDDEKRADVCDDEFCIEHGTGTAGCPVPETWGELRGMQDDHDERGDEPMPMSEVTDDLDQQALPKESMCPYCGSEPTDDSARDHHLSNMGYLHDDIKLLCSSDDCGSTWTCGVPIGSDGADDLFCESCNGRYMRVHRVDLKLGGSEEVGLHLKCPNCYYFKQVRRDVDDRQVSLVGFEDITGSFDRSQEYGYTDQRPDER